jgi:hypothetical protein
MKDGLPFYFTFLLTKLFICELNYESAEKAMPTESSMRLE